MKKTLLTLASVILIISVQAYPMKGVPYVGGSLGFSSFKTKMEQGSFKADGATTTMWNFSPEAGFFISDHFSVGLMLNISGTTVKSNDSTSFYKETSTMTYGIGLNARKYFMMSETFHIFTGLDLNVAPGKTVRTQQSGTENTTSLMGFGANLNLGIAWNVTEKIMIFGKYGVLGYNMSKETEDTKPDEKVTTNTDFGLNVNTYGSPFNVGMYFLLK